MDSWLASALSGGGGGWMKTTPCWEAVVSSTYVAKECSSATPHNFLMLETSYHTHQQTFH